jgi:hypothetical protein
MPIRYNLSAKFSLLASVLLVGCAQTRQVAIDYPSTDTKTSESGQSTHTRQFQALPGFQVIDGDDYYVRLISDFDFKGDKGLKRDCDSIAPSYKKSDLSSALIFNVRNNTLKFNNEAVGFSYQAGEGKCNFKFDAKKLNLTPWIRLDVAKETQVDYSFYSSENSNTDVSGLVSKVTTASNLLALTGVGMGVAVIGQFAGQWLTNRQQAVPATPTLSENRSTESHSLPAIVTFSGKNGTLNETVFKVHAQAEGGINILGSEAKPLGELTVHPEITPTLLLKTTPENLPDARDLSLQEIIGTPIKSTAGAITVQQLIEQSKHPEKPNLKPAWNNYDDVENNCRKLKLVMKDLGFNKFDRNAVIYYFLANSSDWKSYNAAVQQAVNNELNLKAIQNYRSKNFANCLIPDDYGIMKTMGLSVNTAADWKTIEDSSQKKEQFFSPMKSIERQLVAVLKNPNKAEMESQIFPLLTTVKNGTGTVLLQNHLGDFGLEKLLNPPASAAPAETVPAPTVTTTATPAPTTIPGEGLIINAHQLASVFSGLVIEELSCARIPSDQQNKRADNIGILLFTTKTGSPRAKGGAMEFEFSEGKINRISFQLPTYRDFEQDVLDHPEVGGCRIDAAFLAKLH